MIEDDTKTVIVDAGAVTSLDITAADQLEALAESLKKRGIRFYLTEHVDTVNEEMRKLGIGRLIEEGMVRRTITTALKAAGMEEPYPVKEREAGPSRYQAMTGLSAEEENSLEEFGWAFGGDVVSQIERRVHRIMESIHHMPDIEELVERGLPEDKRRDGMNLGAFDEDEILRRIELHLDELPENLSDNKSIVLSLLEKRRQRIREELEQ